MVFDKIFEYLQYIINKLTGIFVKQYPNCNFMLDDDESEYGRLSDNDPSTYKIMSFTN